MKRGGFGAVLGGLVVAGVVAACANDLFHSTNFETLCDREPSNANCQNVTPIDGSGPDTSMPGDGGDGGKPLVDFCQWSSEEAAAQAARACAWVGACSIPGASDAVEADANSAFATCVFAGKLAYDCAANPDLRPRESVERLWSCLSQVTSCDDVTACFWPGERHKCPDTNKFVGCDGDVRVGCDNGERTGLDPCLLQGRTCRARDNEPNVADCVARTSPCTPDTVSCQGSVASDCNDVSVDRGVDCRYYGAGQCASALQTTAGCVGSSSTDCAADDTVTCDGTKATVCLAKKQVTVDCKALGLDCVKTASASAYRPYDICATNTPACAAGESSCVKGNISACVQHRRETFDCAGAGLGPCAVTNGVAHCTTP